MAVKDIVQVERTYLLSPHKIHVEWNPLMGAALLHASSLTSIK